MTWIAILTSALLAIVAPATAAGAGSDSDEVTAATRFRPRDVFELEWTADPRISPDGSRVVYVRSSMDIMTDRPVSELWSVAADGSEHRPLGASGDGHGSPRWSPDGSMLAYLAGDESGRRQVFLYWLDTAQSAAITNLQRSPGDLAWSPDGQQLAFTRFVPEPDEPFAELPPKPEGAEWAPAPKVVDRLVWRADGRGLLEQGFTQLFVLPVVGGTPRRLTSGPYDHRDPGWTPDGEHLIVTANRRPDWEYDPQNTELFEVRVDDGQVRALTDRHGPDLGAAVSPDGSQIAYLGFDDRYQGYQVTGLYVMDRDGGSPRLLTRELDRSVSRPRWSSDGRTIFVGYSDRGNGKLASVTLDGEVTVLASDVGGLSIGRPYAGGSYSLSANDRIAYTLTDPHHPADVAVVGPGREPARLTRLNDDLFSHKELAEVEEIWYRSSHDGRRIQGWIAKPPGFDPSREYPLMLEIHGGPFADYGDRFAAEIQLYAAAGYVVLYTNPRGSTSYGEEFGNLIHHAYPGHDLEDLMSGVDAVIERGYVDEDRLFVTGGSGGGVLSSWIVGHTDRFAAAAVQKPVINWYSWVLTADIVTTYRYWFPALPWEDPEHYLDRSPISRVGHMTTPTLLITGEVDYRTPMSESEQLYHALKLRRVPTALVRIPEASHGISARPSHLVAKVAHVLAWFARYGGDLEATK